MDTAGRLLIADDEEIFLLSTADLLRDSGFLVDCARSAQEATALLSRDRYDLMISDIRMPGNPGLELLKTIPAPNSGIPVILVTGFPTMSTALEAMGRSVLAYLLKPLDFRDLLHHVRRGIALRRVQALAEESSRRLRDWSDEMHQFSADIRSGPANLGAMPVRSLMGLVLGNLASSAMDLKRLVDLGQEIDPAPGLCGIQNCPRLGTLEQALREGVDALERTKGSFKSKELGELRRRFEALLEENTPAGQRA